MKKHFYLLGFLCVLFTSASAQLAMGGFHSNFGVDGDTKSGTAQFGPRVTAPTGSDWFSLPGSRGAAVIDTTNTNYYKGRLAANQNICFVKNMSVPAYSKINGDLWLDAIYIRDHSSAFGSDSSAFGTAAKNGVDPRVWDGKSTNIPAKTDIIDAYAHFRRNGKNVKDSLWFFTGMSTVGVQGERYIDVELFKNPVAYLPAAGAFSSNGLSYGHTEWIFDAQGNIIQAGDLIVAVAYKSGSAPVIDVRIWVSKTTFSTVKPKLFNFGTQIDGMPLAGYANIVSKSGVNSFGSGLGNFAGNATTDETFATPWGTTNGSGWSQNYQQLQFVEMGINFTRIGIDPSLYASMSSSCDRIFHSVFFKSRSSNAFSANLQDFAGPIELTIPKTNHVVIGDTTLTCARQNAVLSVSNPSGVGVYSWLTLDGNIAEYLNDSTAVRVDKKGTYTLYSALADGCTVASIENSLVRVDSIPPVAAADFSVTTTNQIKLLGGDTAASKRITPFGGSQGLIWDWKGPNNFKSSEQDPIINMEWAWGAYNLTLTEARNGCKAWTTMDFSFKKRPMKAAMEAEVQQGAYGMFIKKEGNAHYLVANQQSASVARIMIHNTLGQLLGQKNIQLNAGFNQVTLESMPNQAIRIVSVIVDNQPVLTSKIQ